MTALSVKTRVVTEDAWASLSPESRKGATRLAEAHARRLLRIVAGDHFVLTGSPTFTLETEPMTLDDGTWVILRADQGASDTIDRSPEQEQ